VAEIVPVLEPENAVVPQCLKLKACEFLADDIKHPDWLCGYKTTEGNAAGPYRAGVLRLSSPVSPTVPAALS
jgi:hypothetical protein